MGIFNWCVEFTVSSLVDVVTGDAKPMGDIVNCLATSGPIAFLALRDTDDVSMKILEFGYHDSKLDGWQTSHSPNFKASAGRYKVRCRRMMSGASLLLTRGGQAVCSWTMSTGEHHTPVGWHVGDLMRDRKCPVERVSVFDRP